GIRDRNVTGVQTCALPILRCFEDPNVMHVEHTVDPARDIEIIETELLLADLDTLQKRHERLSRMTRVGQKEFAAAADALAKAIEIGRASCRERGRRWMGER